MPYSPTTWVDNTTPALDAANLNKLELGAKNSYLYLNVVTDYSADSTGAVDATSAFNSATAAAKAAGGGVVFVPTGTYKLNPSVSVQIKSGVFLLNAPGVTYNAVGAGTFGQVFWISEGFTSTTPATRCGIIGGPAVIDYTGQSTLGHRGVQLGGVLDCVVEGIHGVNIPDGNVVHSNGNGATPMTENEQVILRNISCTGLADGYGCVQLTGGENGFLIEHIHARSGGYAVNLENDGPNSGEIRNVTIFDASAIGNKGAGGTLGGVFRIGISNGDVYNIYAAGLRSRGTLGGGITIGAGSIAPSTQQARNITIDTAELDGKPLAGGSNVTPTGFVRFAGTYSPTGQGVVLRNIHVKNMVGDAFVCAGQEYQDCIAEACGGIGFRDLSFAASPNVVASLMDITLKLTNCKVIDCGTAAGGFNAFAFGLHNRIEAISCESLFTNGQNTHGFAVGTNAIVAHLVNFRSVGHTTARLSAASGATIPADLGGW